MSKGVAREIVYGVSIDAPHTRTIEQGMSICRIGAETILSLSIADPLSYLRPGSVEDQNTLTRGFTTVQGDLVHFLLPYGVASALSLNSSKEHPAITISVPIKENNSIGAPYIRRTKFENEATLNYDQTEQALDDKNSPHNDLLQRANRLADRLHAKRVASAVIDLPATMDVDIHRLQPQIGEEDRAKKIVREFSLLVNSVMGQYFINEGIPGIFKNNVATITIAGNQYRVGHSSDIKRALLKHPDAIDEEIELLNAPSFYDVESLGHLKNNLRHNLTVTAPLRRYPDVVNLRQALLFGYKNRPYHNIYDLQSVVQHLTLVLSQHEEKSLTVDKSISPDDSDYRELTDQKNIQTIQSEKFYDAEPKLFHGIMSTAYRTNNITDPLVEEIQHRLYKGELEKKAIYRILFHRYVEKSLAITALQDEIIDWLGNNPFEIVMLLSMTIGETSQLPQYKCKYKITEIKEGNMTHYLTTARIHTEQGEYISRTVKTKLARLGKALAGRSLLYKLFDKEEPISDLEEQENQVIFKIPQLYVS
jgi:hypothetical protein